MVDQLYEESAVQKQITEFYDQQMPERNHQLCKVNIERKLLQSYSLGSTICSAFTQSTF